MSAIKILAMVLIVAGILGLVYGGFTYTKGSHDFKLGKMEMSVRDRQTINIPIWAGVGAIVAGTGLLLLRQKAL